MENIYNLVDKIYCINLISRNDRFEHMTQFEKNENIKLHFYRPKKDPSGGRIGCFKSHIEVIKDAYYSGKEKILVFEDDIIKKKSNNIIDFEQISDFIKNNNKWEMIQFGWTTYNLFHYILPINKISENIYQFGSVLASSYIINRSGMKKIIDSYEKYKDTYHLDDFYKKLFSKTMYNIVPIIFDQNREFTSDNNWFTKSIDNLISFIHIKTNIVYNATLFKYKYSNIVLFILIFLIIYNFLKFIYTKLFI